MEKKISVESNGWVVINIGHPRTGSQYIVDTTFSNKRTMAIKKFIDGSGNNWKYWKRNYNFRVVKANMTIHATNTIK